MTGTRDSEISMKEITAYGNEIPKVEIDSSDSDSDNSSALGYFDPPIQNYRSMQILENRVTGNFEGNMFVIQRSSDNISKIEVTGDYTPRGSVADDMKSIGSFNAKPTFKNNKNLEN